MICLLCCLVASLNAIPYHKWETSDSIQNNYRKIYSYDISKEVKNNWKSKKKIPSIYEWLVKNDKSFKRVYHSYSFPTNIADVYRNFIDIDFERHERLNKLDFFIDDYGVGYGKRPVVWILDSVFLRVSNVPDAVEMYYYNNRDSVKAKNKDSMSGAYIGIRMYDGVVSFKTVTVHTDDDSWKSYLSLPILEKYRPVTVFLDSNNPVRSIEYFNHNRRNKQ